jgi:hypothetical protein
MFFRMSSPSPNPLVRRWKIASLVIAIFLLLIGLGLLLFRLSEINEQRENAAQTAPSGAVRFLHTLCLLSCPTGRNDRHMLYVRVC